MNKYARITRIVFMLKRCTPKQLEIVQEYVRGRRTWFTIKPRYSDWIIIGG